MTTVDDLSQTLTLRQAYFVMFEFLRQHQLRGPSPDLGGMLGDLSLLNDGTSSDAAQLDDFSEACDAVLNAERVPGGYANIFFKMRR